VGAGVIGAQVRPVDIVVQSPKGQRSISLWTFRAKVRNILLQAGIAVNHHDRVTPRLNQDVSHGRIVVDDAIPVWVKTAHRRMRVFSTHYRVTNILKAADIQLSPLDEVQPGLSAKVFANATIHVIRRWIITKKVQVAIPFPVEHRPDPNLYQGHTQITEVGADGLKQETYQILVQNGKPIRQTLVSTQEVKSPTPEIIAYGTRELVDRGGQVLQFSREMTMLATAYWPDPAWSSGYTATGIKAQYGVIAVDPAVIPLGTRVYIPGYGVAIAADTGSAIIGDHIDLCFDTAAQAEDWGVRIVRVFILSP
jgi:uncharacterized protein YabE (DUF348 family)